jgi:hypothetical protein
MMKKMMMGSGEKGTVHPFVLFWLGVLTGAMLVGLAFFYGMWQSLDSQDAILKLNTVKTLQITTPMGGDGGNIVKPMGGDGGN